MLQERKPDESVVREEIPPEISDEGIQFLLKLHDNKKLQITDLLRIQFRGVARYLGKANAAIQLVDYGHGQNPRVNNFQQLQKTHFIVKHVLCPIVYPRMPITEVAEVWRNNTELLQQRIKSFQRIFYELGDGRELLPEEVLMIPQSIEFMRELQTQYPALKKQFDQTFNSKK